MERAFPTGSPTSNYRMQPRNAPCLSAAGIDCCVVANNHVLDWSTAGLEETLATLHAEGIRTAGAGRGAEEAARPAVVDTAGGRVLVFGFAGPDCGVPESWAAGGGDFGVAFLPDYSSATADEVMAQIRAHRLVDAGVVDVIHGHSSHHPRGVEVYGGRVILYGCGDFVNDYEGISGHERYRDDLVPHTS